MSTLSEQEKKKRAAKRYPYLLNAEYEASGQRHEIKLMNISTSGIQFSTKTKLESKEAILIRWRDSRFGGFNPTFLLAREIHKPEAGEFCYFYGAQYYNLSPAMKESLFKLLKHFKHELEKETKQQVEKITPGFLFATIDQGHFFIQSAINTNTPSPYFDSMMKEIKDYERKAYQATDDFSKHIQNLATHNFHCHVLKSLAYVILEQPALQLRFFQYLQTELINIDDVISQTDIEVGKIWQSEQSDEKKKELEKHLSESGNRLYYTIQGTLQLIVETFSGVVTDTSEYKSIFHEIQTQYEQIAGRASTANQKTTTYARRSKRPQEYSRAEAIVDIQIHPEKNRFLQYFLIFILLVVASIIGLIQFENHKNLQAVSTKMDIGLEIKNFEKSGSQINVTILQNAWNSLSPEKKKQVFQKISNYLTNEKKYSTVVLLNEQGGLIRAINKGQTF